ncbi:hypothetical protein EXIGLDRAFT_734626 [Exidia glandulosa HHB12029]|uniref:Uncharacterized protein n=1 Tax=Exidia glandulosa HHB12029 TaxID=1314781 RepID=A0A165PQB7_EXIGL|nr:hypothetical protein EXIGLDRAFT_734626 [Exidia glandulosa HHB12029]
MAPLGLTHNHGFALPRNDFAWSPRSQEAHRPLSGAQNLHRDAQLVPATTKKIAVDPETAWWNCYHSQGVRASSSTGASSCSTSSRSSTSLATPPQDNVSLVGGACSHSEGLKGTMTPKHIALLEQTCYEAHVWELNAASQKMSNTSEVMLREKGYYDTSGFVPPGDWMFALEARLMEQPEPHTDFCVAPVARRTLPLPIDPFAANAYTGDHPLYSAATTTPMTSGPREPLLFAPVRPRKLQTRRKQDSIKWNIFLGKHDAQWGNNAGGRDGLESLRLVDQLEMDLGRGRSCTRRPLRGSA